MNQKDKIIYKKIVDDVIANTKIVGRPISFNEMTDREKLWHKLSNKIYVIGLEKTKEYFDIEAEKQGFKRLLTYVYPKYAIDSMSAIEGGMTFKDWLRGIGPHISQSICSTDIVKNNLKRALVFESDTAFTEYISNDFLSDLIDVYDSKSMDYLNIGYGTNGDIFVKKPCFDIVQAQTPLSHAYIISNNAAKIQMDSIDINKDKIEAKYFKPHNDERYYRAGGDDFFIGYIESYALTKAITYQQAIGNNREFICTENNNNYGSTRMV